MAENTLGQVANKGLAFKALILSAIFVSLAACFSTSEESEHVNTSTPLLCDDSIKTAMSSYSDTEVLLVKPFQQGEQMLLGRGQNQSVVEGGANASVPKAEINLCLVKLLIGPGNPGPEEAPSKSAGIGIEVLLPAHDQWNRRIRAYGNSGWSGTPQASLTQLASDDIHAAAVGKGFVVATSDNGHRSAASIPPLDPSFAMNPDGSINQVGWQDFSERSLHQLAEKTKALTKLYYGQAHKYAYWDGFSTGGRQGLKLAQKYPNDFDGILVGAPAINWSTYHTAGLYAQIAMKQDLGYMIDHEKLTAVTEAAINACGGAELGFLLDPLSCKYDPTQDESNLCEGVPGNGGIVGKNDSEACLTLQEATIINKAWYGQTVDGSVPAPATDNGSANILQNKERIWFGWTRGTDLKTTSAGGAPGIILAADQAALELQDPTLGSDFFKNATGNGENKWLDALNYAGLSHAQEQGLLLQPEFSNINTDNPDLSAFADAGSKIVMYQGLADEYIPAQGAINYYERVMAEMGGKKAVQEFFRLYLIPGFTHSGRSEGLPHVPVPQPATGRDEMFAALQSWVESDEKPESIEVESSNTNVSLPLCVYPQKITYSGQGSVKSASNYACN